MKNMKTCRFITLLDHFKSIINFICTLFIAVVSNFFTTKHNKLFILSHRDILSNYRKKASKTNQSLN